MHETNEQFNQMKQIADLAPCGIGVFDLQTSDPVLLNQAFYSLIGYTEEEYVGFSKNIDYLLMQDDKDIAYDNRSLFCSDGKVNGSIYRIVRKSGEICWVKLSISTITIHGKQYAFTSFSDITAEKEALTQLSLIAENVVTKEQESSIEKQRFQKVINELNAVVFEWNLKTGNFYCSDAYNKYAFSRINQDDILNNRGSLDVVHQDDVPILKKFFAGTDSGEEKVEVVLRLKTIDGFFHWCRMIGFFYKDENGVPNRTVGVIIDINDEHEKSFMLSSILNELPGGVAILYYAKEMKCQYFNDRFASLGGRTRKDVERIMDDGTFMEVVVAPSDYKRVMDTVKRCVFAGEPINLTYRFLHKDGSVHWIHLSGSKIREENGFPVYYCVFTTPSEEAELYRDVVENSPVGVIVLDKKKRNILYINDIGKEQYNITDKDIVNGRSVMDVLKEHDERPILSKNETDILSYKKYSEYHGIINGKYLVLRAKAIVWNSIDAYVLYIIDETNEHEEQIRLQKLINGVPAGIGIFEADENRISLVYMNDAYYHEIGISRDSREKYHIENVLERIHPDDRNSLTKMVQAMVSGKNTGEQLVRLQNRFDEWIWFKLSGSVVERKEKCIRIYVSFANCNDMIMAKQKLEENKIKEQIMLSSIPGGAVIYRLKKNNGVILEYASEGFAKLMGYQNSEELYEDIKGDAISRIPPKDAQELSEHVLSALENHEPISFIYNVYTRTNSIVKIRMDANVITDTQMGTDDIALIYAVHTLVSMKSQLALEEQKRYRSLMDALDVAMMEWNRDEEIFASEKYSDYEISTESIENIIHNHITADIVFPDDKYALDQFFADCQKKPERASCILRMKMTNGTYRWTEMQGFFEYDSDRKIRRLIGVLRDIDKERIEQNERLQEALAAANKASEAKSSFLSRVSHDMRTPLNGMLGLASIMAESVIDNRILSDLAQMEMSGKYLLNLINDTLDVSRIESGKLELNPSVCEGRAIFESVIALSKPVIESKHIHSQYFTDGLTYPLLYIDIGRVQQIMMNILGNAAKFTADGGHITCTMKNLSIIDGIITDEVCIEDDGIGMSAEFLPHIFDAFSQADNSKKNSREGTGLGMIITKQLVELMGGTITVESTLGKGTKVTFTLLLPIATDAQIETWKKTRRTEIDDTFLNGKKILLCEDHPLNAKISTRLLEKKGLSVLLAENGKIALEKFASVPVGYFDAILMDIRMPFMDGMETTVAIRDLNRPDAMQIPIIAITANAFDDDVKQARQAGMDEHLSKPIDAQKLYETLYDLIRYGRGGKLNSATV